ncbi:chromate efflux transporter [Deinococcus puniceus]|uniref:Chromate transporter n=1 Tax=Deinococcus puniceus TaxID=1182568 RepID=A0A172TCG6_9DEIO|nr:chromate efflux transporter [Deinococcus puniceus]ANE44624.1 chromate transporter [Deinococcus puniceus]
MPPRPPNSPAEIFRIFLRLGLTSFGGPVAHLGYFRIEFVTRRGWFSEAEYADLVALAQFLPGPASSQVGLSVGLLRGGWWGMLAAWLAFTGPSAALMFAFALGIARVGDVSGAGWLLGLKVAAVAVVAQAVAGMWGSLVAADERAGQIKAGLALGAAALVLIWPGAVSQVLALVLAGAVGWRVLAVSGGKQAGQALPLPLTRRVGAVLLGLCAALLLGLPLLASLGAAWALADTFYRAGALVFGGGHVVLPLLQAGLVPAFLPAETFVAGYGAANAVPGPLFTFASYLGASQTALPAWAGATIATVFIFLPGALLMVGALPFWAALSARPAARAALSGINAGVVGLLLAALYDPLFMSAITGPRPLALALLAYAALTAARLPAWAVVGGCAVVGAVAL